MVVKTGEGRSYKRSLGRKGKEGGGSMRPDDLIEELEEEDHPSSLSSLPTMPFSSFHRSSSAIRVGPGSRVGERIENKKRIFMFFVCCADSHVRKSQGSCFYGTWPAIFALFKANQ